MKNSEYREVFRLIGISQSSVIITCLCAQGLEWEYGLVVRFHRMQGSCNLASTVDSRGEVVSLVKDRLILENLHCYRFALCVQLSIVFKTTKNPICP